MSRSGSIYWAYRINIEDRVIAYTGDTEWTDGIVELGRSADLLIGEAYFYEKPVPFHLSYKDLLDHLPAIDPKRLILTHMSEDMLSRSADLVHVRAVDGMRLVF